MKMKRKHEVLGQIARRGLLVGAVLAMVLSVATTNRAQSSATIASAQDAKPATDTPEPVQASMAIAKPAAISEKNASLPTEKSAPSGPREGITVHGHWTIEVHNPDGKLVSHNEFENSLSSGGYLLSSILNRQYSTGYWSIILSLSQPGQSQGETPACTATVSGLSGLQAAQCYITEPQVAISSPLFVNLLGVSGCSQTASCSNNLMISSSPTPNLTFSIMGSVTAAQAGTIDAVTTALSMCGGASGNGSANYAPCLSSTLPLTPTSPQYIYAFSSTFLAGGNGQQPIQVLSPGQTIQATVQFSFH